MVIQHKKGISVPNVTKNKNKKKMRIESKKLLKKVVNAFNYASEPQSINTEDWTDGHP
jgi:hypothetical protein